MKTGSRRDANDGQEKELAGIVLSMTRKPIMDDAKEGEDYC